MKTISGIVVLFVCLFSSSLVFAWGSNATGTITDIVHEGDYVPYVIVQGNVEGGKLWLGFSYSCGKSSWIHIKARKIKKGDFSERFTMKICHEGYTRIRSCLWEGKNGGKMEGKVDCMDR